MAVIMAAYGEVNVDESIPSYKISPLQLQKIVDAYRERKFAEDIDAIEEIGDLETLASYLQTSLSRGLPPEDDSQIREDTFGSNDRGDRQQSTFWELMVEAFEDFMLRVLVVAGAVSLGLGIGLGDNPSIDWIEGFSIILAVLIVVLVTSINNYSKEKKFAELQESGRNRDQVSIIRNGNTSSVNPKEVLVGDLLVLADGIVIPCDGVLINGENISIDEATMTGENEKLDKESYSRCIVKRDERLQSHPEIVAEKVKPLNERADHSHDVPSPIILSGTKLADGEGLMLVIAVGSFSAEGRIIDLGKQKKDNTPLELKLDNLAQDISKFGLVSAAIAVGVLFLRYFIELGTGTHTWSNSDINDDIINFFILGITILVLAIPEGLPLAVAISLAYSIKEMQREANLVKTMDACETMGGADCICSDKTGTLTTNDMTVAQVFYSNEVVDLEAKRDRSSTIFKAEFFALLKEGICCNSTCYIDKKKGEQGNKTELALIKMLKELGHTDYIETREHLKRRDHQLFPFSSGRKRSSMVITLENGSKRVHVKGGAEMIVSNCTHYITKAGFVAEIDEDVAASIDQAIFKMTSHGLRAICLAYRDLPEGYNFEAYEEGVPVVETDSLVFMCVTGIKDPVRDKVPEAVEKCKRAQIKVRMVTGDNVLTATAIAKECGILLEDGVVMEGPHFTQQVGGVVCKKHQTINCDCPRDSKKLIEGETVREDVIGDIEKFRELVVKLDVMARSKPDDKYCLVTGLKQLGHVVAVTGDGTNDAPALRKADIGFAMGLSGTQMARECADIILMDDNFASIVRAVLWGRNIYDNIQRFIQFQLSVNIIAVVTSIVGAVTIQQSSLTAVQMLWVNLIMDTFASLALATQPPKENLLLRKPQGRDEYIITRMMWKHIFGQSVVQMTLIFLLMYLGEWFLPENGTGGHALRNPDDDRYVISGRLYHFNGDKDYYDDYKKSEYGPSRHFTYIFNIFVILQLFNEINCRKIKDELNIFEGLWDNKLFLFIWFLTISVQVILIEATNVALNVNYDGLTLEQWALCFAFGMIPLPVRLLLRLIPDKCFKETGNVEADLAAKSSLGIAIRRSANSRSNRLNSHSLHSKGSQKQSSQKQTSQRQK